LVKSNSGFCSAELWNKCRETISFVTTRVISDLRILLARLTSKVGGNCQAAVRLNWHSKKCRFCRCYDIKCFTWFPLQL